MIAFKLEKLAKLAEKLMAIKLQQWSLQSLIVIKKLYLLMACIRIITMTLPISLVVFVISTPLIWVEPLHSGIFTSIALSSLSLTLILVFLLRVAFADKTILRNIELVDTTPAPERLPDVNDSQANLEDTTGKQRDELLKQLEALLNELKTPSV